MHSEETKDTAYNVLDISIDPWVNAAVHAPLVRGILLDALAERYIKRCSKVSNGGSRRTKRSVGSHEEKTDKEIKKAPIGSPSDQRNQYEMIHDSLLFEKTLIPENSYHRRQKSSLEIKPLKLQYFKNETILFKIPDQISSCEEWLRVQMTLIWQRLDDELGSRLSLELDNHCLRASGTYNDSCTLCYFDAQVWKVEFGIWSERDYALEFRRTSLNGQEAFDILLQHAASGLKDLGAAEEFGNGQRILPFGDGLLDLVNLSCWESFTIDDLKNQSTDEETEEDTAPRNILIDAEAKGSDTDDLRKRFEELDYFQCDEPVSLTMDSLHCKPLKPRVSINHKNSVLGPKRMNCMIRLGDELFELWRSHIEQRVYPAAGEAIRTLRMCCYEADIDENVKALRRNKALLNALCIELELQSARVRKEKSNRHTWANAEVCINILEIYWEIVKSPSNDEFFIKRDILQLVANCAYFFSGYMNIPEVPVPRTTGIVLAALRILDVLTDRQGLNLPAKKSKAILDFLKLHPIDMRKDVDDCRTLQLKLMNKLRILGEQ